jgi:hypothetical protein
LRKPLISLNFELKSTDSRKFPKNYIILWVEFDILTHFFSSHERSLVLLRFQCEFFPTRLNSRYTVIPSGSGNPLLHSRHWGLFELISFSCFVFQPLCLFPRSTFTQRAAFRQFDLHWTGNFELRLEFTKSTYLYTHIKAANTEERKTR